MQFITPIPFSIYLNFMTGKSQIVTFKRKLFFEKEKESLIEVIKLVFIPLVPLLL